MKIIKKLKTDGSFKKGHLKAGNCGAKKGTHNSPNTEFKKGHKIHLGRKHSLEQNKKHSEDMKKLFAEGKLKPLWKEKELSKEHIRKIVETRIKNGSYKVKKETIEKIKNYWKLNTHPSKGKKYPKELYPNYGIRSFRDKLILPKKDTSIEIKIQNFLKQLYIEFFTHQHMHIEHGYQCDIFIPNLNTIIECDGDYWHGNRELFSEDKLSKRILNQRKLDNIRTRELIEKGYKVIRLWEKDIKLMNINKFKEIIL